MIVQRSYLLARGLQVRQFLSAADRGREIQRQVLLEKIRRHTQSVFGRRHHFARIRTVEDFRREVPITSYDDYRPYIERLKRGDLRALFGPGTRLLMFALTSGTTGDAKYIPVTREFFNEYRKGWNLWGLRTYADHTDLLRKRTLQFSSNWRQFATEGGTPCGNISGLAAETAPWISRPIFLLPRALTKICDPIAKRYTALRLSLADRSVGMIVTANPSTLVELARLADGRRESLIRDLFDGALSDWVDMPGEVRDSLRRWIARRDPARARELERIVERTGALFPRDFWPALSVLAIWTGGSAGAYLPCLRKYYGDTAIRDHGLSASEGRMTLPFRDGTPAGMLDYVHSFFEFIPEAEYGKPHPTVLEAHELEENQNYFIVLTTSSGFYRYDIHDLIRCVGFEGTVPILEFLNKGAHYSNITGEKLSEFQVVSAVRSGFLEVGLPMETFSVAPVFGDPAGYELLLEGGIGAVADEVLPGSIDRHLSLMNREYAERLESGRLRPLQLRKIPHGAWERLRLQRTSGLGGNMEQYKHPCLLNDLGDVERLCAPTSSQRSSSRTIASVAG
ncbi:MAG: GH3 auxin-responsive promoter family protein [Rhodopirellula sp.]|nr:GH3 auxin-responsive promoter family protein [Rhodopirellula sp.]